MEDRLAAAAHFRSNRMGSDMQQASPELALAAQVPFACDTMTNPFNRAFGAWPETYIVVGGDGELVLRTEAEVGSGTLKGGTWDQLVRQTLLRL